MEIGCQPQTFLFRDLLPSLPEKPTIYLDSIDPLALAPLVEFIYGGEARVAKTLLPAFMEAANILKVKGLVEEEVNHAEEKQNPAVNSKENVLDEKEELQTNPSQDKPEDKNVDDCLMRKFEGLEDEIDAVMKDVKTFEGEEEEDDSTLNEMESQEEDVRDKAEEEEDVVKLAVVEEYVKDPKMENVEDERFRGRKDTEGGRLSCDLCSFVTAAKKRNSRIFAKEWLEIL